jgi:hypothetical protein
MASTSCEVASSYTPAIHPTTANASARIGKKDRKPKKVTAPARAFPFTSP